nr:RNA-directed DNA polymerase, eukaryota [Tanacetum cinerariifolium]
MVAKDDETSKEKEIDKLMALISLSFKKIYKPTNNNLRTSSNTSRANQDNSLRINRSDGYENERNGNVAGAMETVGSSVVQKYGIQCYNCKEFGHVARESNQDNSPRINRSTGYENQRIGNVAGARETVGSTMKPKRAKDAAYHREKMLLCKQEEAGIQLNAEQADWRDDTDDDELEDQELEAHYIEPIDQNDDDDADLIHEHKVTNLQCDYLELLEKCECLEKELSKSKMMSKSFEALQKHAINLEIDLQQLFEIQDMKAQLQDKGIVISKLKKLIAKLKEKYVDTKFGKSSVIRQPNDFKSQRPLILGKPTIFSDSLERNDFSKSKSVTQNNMSNGFSKPVTTQTLPPNKKSILKNMNVLAPRMYKLYTEPTQDRTSQLPQDSRKTNKRMSFYIGVIPTTSVSRPQPKSNPMEDRVMLNNIKGKKHEVDGQRRNVKLSKNNTVVTECNDSLNVKTLNVNFVCTICGKCVLNEKHDMCVLKSINDVNSRTKMHIDVPLVEIILFIVDSGCSKHMMENLKLLINFVETFLGTVKFGNDQISPILGYEDLVQGAVTIKHVYYIEGLNHNLFFVGQFCDADLEVAFRKSTCFIRDLKGNDLLTGSRSLDLYSITLQDTNCPNPICLMAKATSSQAWLWHRRLSHLNFDTINLLSKNDIVVGLPKLKFVKDHLCSSYESKDETPEVLIDFLRLVQRRLQAQVRIVQTDKGTEFLNQSLHAYFAAEGILHQTSVARTPEQNGVVERRNRTLVEAARTMLSAAKVPPFFWAEAIATTCFTQNHSLVIPRHEKTPYHIINDRKPSVKFVHIFGSLCYIIRDGENLDKMKEKDKTVTTSNEMDLLFSPMFDELLNGSSKVVSKSSAISTADAPNQRQQHTTPLNNHITPKSTFTVSQTEPKNIKEAMADSSWIELMQEELYQLDRLETNAKELWSICNQYGNVIDAFIPNRRSKMGKRFGFIRFIKTFDVERLTTVKGGYSSNVKANSKSAPVVNSNRNGVSGPHNSYIQAAKAATYSHSEVKVSKPSLVLEESCLHDDLALSLIGKLKEFGSLPNLNRILMEEGFTDINIRYMGDMHDEESDSDAEWTVRFITFFETEEIPETVFDEPKHVEFKSSTSDKIHNESYKDDISKDPFNIYTILNKEKPATFAIQHTEGEPQYPPGFTSCDRSKVNSNLEQCSLGGVNQAKGSPRKENDSMASHKESVNALGCSRSFQKADIFNIKACWGNLSFNSVVSPSVGSTGGSLCVWDSNMFLKENSTVSDYFIAIMGTWLPNNKRDPKWTTVKGSYSSNVKANSKSAHVVNSNRNGVSGPHNSYIQAAKVATYSRSEVEVSKPSLVLEESCLHDDLALSLNGKLKEFGSLPNLNRILMEEGFTNINIRYMGGFLVLLQFSSKISKENFMSRVGVNSWFFKINHASNSFYVDERVAWIEIKGVPLYAWSHNTSSRISSTWGTLLYDEDEGAPRFHRKRLCINITIQEIIFDSIKIIVKRKVFWIRVKELTRWAPNFKDMHDEESDSDAEWTVRFITFFETEEILETVFDEPKHAEFKSSTSDKIYKEAHKDDISKDSFHIYTILNKEKPATFNVQHTEGEPQYPPGFTSCDRSKVNSNLEQCSLGGVNQEKGSPRKENDSMASHKESVNASSCSGGFQKAKKDWVRELCYNNKVNFLTLLETKIEPVDIFNIKACWGNLSFDLVVSPSVGSTGGSLCVWDSNMFLKENSTVLDYFIAIMGTWLPNNKSMLIISVYAPQDLAKKKMLWNYLNLVINRWKGDVIVMGDFNEVRSKDERYGSSFNARGAAAFNSFISARGLMEVPAGDYSFTCSHKSASKMSRLDRFLVSENLQRWCPNLSSVVLDRYLSDHRPIILRELSIDYGPTPFCFFHNWFDLVGFESFVVDAVRTRKFR